MAENEQENSNNVESGMDVDVTKGDLGSTDISKPKVTDVVRDQHGNVKEVVVSKGVLFKKKLEIPSSRIESIDTESQQDQAPGKVTIATNAGETGAEQKEERERPPAHRNKFLQMLHTIGPGFLSGMAGNDATACTTYAIDGATAGYGHLWLMFLSTPMYQSVQFACARIGRITGKGFSELLREHYSKWVAIFAALVLIVADVALVAGNLVAIGSGLSLITGLSWLWFVVPVAVILWYITVFRSFDALKKIFMVMSLAFVAYLITAIFSGASWSTVLLRTFVPQVQFNFNDVSAAVALMGATISSYSMFWQTQEETEQRRPGTIPQQLRFAILDTASGTIGGNLVSYFIIVTTAATLFTHHQPITTAADAAQALGPLLGPFAKYLFALGLIGAGVIAIPVMLASTSYAVAGTFGWPSGLARKPWQSEGFYLILTAALLVSLVLALLRFNPIQLIFWANILVGILAPILVIYILIIGNNHKIMGRQRLSLLNNVFLLLTAFVLIAGALLFFYGLIAG